MASPPLPCRVPNPEPTPPAVVARPSAGGNGAPVRTGCGELPEGILEATLFGHTRDTYTSARSDQPGLLKDTGNLTRPPAP
ncbi:sigma 54-interacting transcriptional regulator (plasmid) [Azospirillum melinis]|uniref:sigma 54-interacting transcriptional regulator n=1 Tax=Azospirillum melinis TaxID=328839 RepID=UPI003756DB79